MQKKDKTARRKDKQKNRAYYLNPKNMSVEIESFGFKVTTQKMLIYYGLYIASMLTLGFVFKLGLLAMLAIVAAGIFVMPTIIINGYRNQYEQRRFSDVSQYMEQILYSFRGNKKIVEALKDTSDVFENGPMKEKINQAISHIYTSKDGEIEKDALKMIENEYKCEKLRTIHRFLIKVESLGGEFNNSIDLLLQDRSMWADRQLILSKDRQKKRISVIVSIFVSIFLCYILQNNMLSIMNAESKPIVQLSVVLLVWLDLFIYAKVDTMISVDWLQTKDSRTTAQIKADYEYVVNYNEAAEKKKSRKWLIVPIVVAAYGLFAHLKLFLIGGIIFIPLLLFNHKITYAMKIKNLKREVEIKFPRWLMEVALLLQTDSVAVAIGKSIESAPTVLKPELIKLRRAIETDNSVRPYLYFMSFLKMSEIQSSMKMLYSIASGTGGDADTQINDIIRRNNLMLDKAEKLANEESLASIQFWAYAPQLTGALKIISDMIVFAIELLKQQNNW